MLQNSVNHGRGGLERGGLPGHVVGGPRRVRIANDCLSFARNRGDGFRRSRRESERARERGIGGASRSASSAFFTEEGEGTIGTMAEG